MTTCQSDSWVCQALERLGVQGFAARTIEFLLLHPLRIALILLLAVAAGRYGSRLARTSVITVASRSGMRDSAERAALRADTLGSVSANVVRVAVWTFAVLAVLDEFGLNLGPLLAGASIVGVAVGFGAQSLVKDFLSGFFILVEDQYGLGDSITVSEVSGVVEEVNLRLTRIRAADGTVWFVPNGEIRTVGNAAKGWCAASVDVMVPRRVDLGAARAAVAEESAKVAAAPEWADAILEAPQLLGVEAMTNDTVTLRVSVRTRPGDRAAVARELRNRISSRLQADGMWSATPPP